MKKEEEKKEDLKKDDQVAKTDEKVAPKKEVAPIKKPDPEPPSPLVDKMSRKDKDSLRPSELFQQVTHDTPKTTSVTSLMDRLSTPNQGAATKLADVRTTTDPADNMRINGVNRIDGIANSLPQGGEPTFAKDGGTPSAPLAGDAAQQVGKKLTDAAPVRTGSVRGKVTGMKSATRVTGSLDPGQIYDVIDKSIGKIQACYEGRLRVDPSLAGRITFRWTVSTSGGVGGVQQTASTLTDPEVAACIKRVLQTLRFPKPDGGVVEVSYPFIFRSS